MEQKRGEGKQILKREGGKLGLRGAWNPLTNYAMLFLMSVINTQLAKIDPRKVRNKVDFNSFMTEAVRYHIEIKSLIHRKNSLYQRQRKSGSIDYTSLNALAIDISNAVSYSKLKYHERLANKLNDPKTAPKTYWAILNTFVNGSKIPLISSLQVDNKLVTDFLDKANLFNNFFAKQCTPIC